MRPPFRTNFMLEVPDASVPAVEICCEMSLAGMMISWLIGNTSKGHVVVGNED
jgi:hypothetical protein